VNRLVVRIVKYKTFKGFFIWRDDGAYMKVKDKGEYSYRALDNLSYHLIFIDYPHEI
jgi:transposase-like protein